MPRDETETEAAELVAAAMVKGYAELFAARNGEAMEEDRIE